MTSEQPGETPSKDLHAVLPIFAQLAMGCSNPTSIGYVSSQCSRRGSPSVLGKDEDGGNFVVPSRLFLNLPDKEEPRTRTDGIVSSPTVPHRPTPSPVVLCRPLSSPAVPRRLPMLSAVFRRPPPSPVVLCSYLPSPGRSCLRSWGSSSLLMTAVLGIKGRGRTTFCRPVWSGGLGSPPAGPYGGPGRLRTLSVPLEGCASQETIWDFDVSTVPGILNTPDLSPIRRIVQPIVIHRHSLWHYHTRVYNSVNGARGGVAVKKGRAAVKESGAAVRKRGVNR